MREARFVECCTPEEAWALAQEFAAQALMARNALVAAMMADSAAQVVDHYLQAVRWGKARSIRF